MSKFNIAEYFKKSVTLPRTTVTLYTDGEKAWEYKEISDRISAAKAEQDTLVRLNNAANAGPRGIADDTTGEDTELDSQLEALTELRDGILAELAESGVQVEVRAMYPKERRIADEKSHREAKAAFADKETPSDEEVAALEVKLVNANYLATAVTKMTYPDGTVVEAPIKAKDFEVIEEYLDDTEYIKLIQKLNELNMAQAMRDAQGDAGFPGGLSEQTGE